MRKDKAGRRRPRRDRNRPALTMPRPENGLPEDIREHMRLMCDLIALGFQTDKTRIATLLLCRDISGLFYPFLDVTHRAPRGLARRQVRGLPAGHAVLRRASSPTSPPGSTPCPRATGTVLDNTCLLFTNSLFSGTKHDASKVPVVLAGGLGGTLETGRVLDYRDKGDDHRKLCSLYLGIMDRMGVQLDRFGDADTRLAGF